MRGVCLWRVGSSPTARTIILPDSVTVSTSDSDSLCLGSNPSQAAKKSVLNSVRFFHITIKNYKDFLYIERIGFVRSHNTMVDIIISGSIYPPLYNKE